MTVVTVARSLAQVHGGLAYGYDDLEGIENVISEGKWVEAEIERRRTR